MRSTAFTVTVGTMTAIAIIGTIASAVTLYRGTKRHEQRVGPKTPVTNRVRPTKR